MNKFKMIIILFSIILLNTSCSNEKKTSKTEKVITKEKYQKQKNLNLMKIKENISVNNTRIFPRLKANYGHEIYQNDNTRNATKEKLSLPDKFKPISMNLFEDINLTFIADRGNEYVMLQQEFYKHNPKVNKDSLFTLAVTNLMKEIGDKIEMRGNVDDIGMLTAGGNFEATIIMISGTWDHLHKLFGKNIVFCIPANDIFYVCKEGNEDAIKKMKAQISEWFNSDNQQGLISKGIYIRNSEDKSIKLIDVAD